MWAPPVASSASAQPPPGPRLLSPLEAQWFQPPVPRAVPRAGILADPVAFAAVANLVLGGVMLAIGIPAWATSSTSEERCGAIAGCFDAVDVDVAALGAGGTLVGMGLGFGVTGALTLGIIAGSPKTAADERKRPAVATVGLMFTGLSLGALVGGFTLGAAHEAVGDFDPFESSVPLFLTSGLAALVGLPMIGAGAPFASPEARARRRLERSSRAPRFDPVPASVVVGPDRAVVGWMF